MAQTVIESLRNYFLTCPYMKDGRINIDYLPDGCRDGVEYSIDTTPASEILRRYTDGSTRRQYLFVLRSVNDYGTDTLQQIANSGFFEALSAWLESQTESGVLPMLGEKRCAEKIEAQTTGYLQGAGPDIGKFSAGLSINRKDEIKCLSEKEKWRPTISMCPNPAATRNGHCVGPDLHH